MKKIILITAFLSISFSCNAQNNTIKDLSKNSELNYIFARLDHSKIVFKELYEGGVFIKIFRISDSKNTPESFSAGTEEFLESFFISISPDGDYYSKSKLLLIEKLVYPKIIEIKETDYPKFVIKIEQGEFNKRYIQAFHFKGFD